MANREALRELHSRLASRLQAARTDNVAASWLAVEAGAGKYLLPLAQAGEIFPWSPYLSVPYTHPWFLGVANLRGGLFGVVDLAGCMTSAAGACATAGAPESVRSDARLVSFNPALEINCVLLVDRLAGLRHASAFTSMQVAAPDASAVASATYTDALGVGWQALDLLALSRQSEFLSISV
jgi:twitching motility protein PilI